MATLVLLPGLDGTGRLFAPLLRELPVDWHTRVMRYPADAALGYDELVRLAEAALPPAGPLILLGESFSGPVAIRLAASLGPRLQALILCCSFARSPRSTLRRLVRFVGWLPSPARLPAAWSAWALLGAGAPSASRQLLVQVLAGTSPEVLQARLKMVALVDVRGELPRVQAPVLYLQASADRLVPSSAASDIRQALPGVSVVQLPGGHGLLQAAPAAAAAAITSFVEQIRTGL